MSPQTYQIKAHCVYFVLCCIVHVTENEHDRNRMLNAMQGRHERWAQWTPCVAIVGNPQWTQYLSAHRLPAIRLRIDSNKLNLRERERERKKQKVNWMSWVVVFMLNLSTSLRFGRRYSSTINQNPFAWSIESNFGIWC